MKSVSFDPFAGGELLRVCPTTWPQKEIIASAHMSDEANTAFNEALSISIEGELKIELLELCFNKLIERHDILRATFSRKGDEICLHEFEPFKIDYEDLRHLDEKAQREVIADLWRNIAISPMNLEEGPLFFVWIKHLNDDRHELIIAAHHVVCDGWSFGILLKELVEIYKSGGSADTLNLAPSFFDFAEHQAATAVANADTDYWFESFDQLPPIMDLPLDRPRPARRSFSAARLDYYLDKTLVAKLPKAASKLKSSLVNFILAGYFTLLHRLTGNQDIVVGLPFAGQAAFNQLNLFGHMVQLIPIRLKFSGDTTFAELVQLVKKEVLDASDHPNFTFAELLKKFTLDRSRVPLISTIFNIDQLNTILDFGTATATIRSVPRAAENFEIFLNIVPSKDDFQIEATYSTSLFSEPSIESWLHALETILSECTKDHNQQLDSLILSTEPPEEVKVFNQTQMEISNDDLISGFRIQRERRPDAIAAISDDQSLTYRELDKLVSRFANYLSTQGVSEGTIVGICCQRSIKLLISTLAVLKLGAAYLPLDPDFPPDRLVYMIEDSSAIAIIEDDMAPQGVRESNITHIDINVIDSLKAGSVSLPQVASGPDRLAYLIYTSGSTGKPKGVKVQNIAMINFLESMANTPGFTEDDSLLAVTTLSFDISVLELFMPLIVGGKTVIVNSQDYNDGECLANLIEQHNISVMQATPSTWRMLLVSSWPEKIDRRSTKFKALCGGEPLPQSLVNELLPHVSELWNMYGPTETTVWSTCKQITNDSMIFIGPPIANTQVYILDANLNPLPVSAPGELCIGGTGVTLGYNNRPELNADRFVHHPDFGRIYRTGDVAKVLPGGDIQHLGRMGDQVKLRGYRIELGEIETALMACSEVKRSAVYLWTLSEEDVRIVACCVPESKGILQTNLIRKQIREKLPNYMVPQYFLIVDDIPLTPNGKVNRRALPRPEVSQSTILSKSALSTDNERLVGNIWKNLLKLDRSIGQEDNFFEIGGHSLLALEFILQLEKATGKRITLRDVINNSLSLIANDLLIDSTKKDGLENGPKALSTSEERGLSSEQQRLLMRQLKYPESVCNNLRGAWLLEGSLDLDCFKKSLQRVYERQTALRTIIQGHEGEYRQTLLHVSNLFLPDYEDYSESTEPLGEALNNAYQLMTQPFAPIGKLLNRTKLYRLGSKKYLFIIVAHQLIFDGWSYDIFLGEIEKAYQAFKENRPFTTHQLSFEFRDYAQWCRTRDINKENLNYHRQTLDGISDIGFFKNTQLKGECNRREFSFPKAKLVQLENFCATHDLRLHEFLLTIFIEALSDKINQNRIVIGMPVSGRYNPDVIGLVGSFVSVLPFEVRIHNNGLIHNVKSISQQLNVFHEHQDISYAEIVQGTSRDNELFPTELIAGFSFQDVRNRPTILADLSITQIITRRKETEIPIEFWTRIQADGFLAFFDYDRSIVPEETIEALGLKIFQTIRNLENLDKQAQNTYSETDKQPVAKKALLRRLFQ